MKREPLPRLDLHPEIVERLKPYCRLAPGEVWEDPVRGHRVAVLDAASAKEVERLFGDSRATLAIADPPYNLQVGGATSKTLSQTDLKEYLRFSGSWVDAQTAVLGKDAHLYVWLGADPASGFQPLPDFMVMMRERANLTARNLITMRNQRGYGTQRNWMWVRQELLHYSQGKPPFHVVYTDIPKILRGYYKSVGGQRRENLERSRSGTLRPGNVWVDIQQVFYRMIENVPGAYAQKPLAAYERIIRSSSNEGDLIADLFAHSGTSLLAAERLGRRCYTSDIDPLFAEIAIRRLEHYRRTGKCGWQVESPFPEIELPIPS